jgi:hypothetical protein
LSFGITIDALYARFRRFKIAPGRRWRDFEDAADTAAPLTRDQIRGYGRAS